MPINNVLQDSRISPPVLRARLTRAEDGRLHLHAPAVGLYRGAPAPGTLVVPDQPIGALEVLGVTHHLLAPPGATGLVQPGSLHGASAPGPLHAASAPGSLHAASSPLGATGLARRPVAFDELLFTLDPEAVHASRAPGAADGAVATTRAAVLRAPTSGRYYGRPGPGKPAFVAVGDVVTTGQAVGLIEVMKTFSRILYGGDSAGASLPPRARVRAILQADEADVAAGDPLLELEPVAEDEKAEPHPT